MKETSLFKLGCGDCLELMKELPDDSVDCVFTDLPYGITDAFWDKRLSMAELWKEWKRIVRPKGQILLFGSQPFTTMLISSNMKDYKYLWYWRKSNATGALNAYKQPLRSIEEIVVFVNEKKNPEKRKATYNLLNLQPCEPKIRKKSNSNLYRPKKNNNPTVWTGFPNNVLEFRSPNNSKRLHPSQKPTDLLEFLIRVHTNEGDTVLDCCMGSGSTGVAAINTGRKFIGFEMDEKFYKISEDRLIEAEEELSKKEQEQENEVSVSNQN